MTLQEKNSPQEVEIFWSNFLYPLGISLTNTGISHIYFYENRQNFVRMVRAFFPNATITQKGNISFDTIVNLKNMHIFCTHFQYQIFQELLSIPIWNTKTYEDIAKNIKKPKAYRSVGTAIGNNNIALLIPCHRIVQKSWDIGQYRWWREKKIALLNRERQKYNAI